MQISEWIHKQSTIWGSETTSVRPQIPTVDETDGTPVKLIPKTNITQSNGIGLRLTDLLARNGSAPLFWLHRSSQTVLVSPLTIVLSIYSHTTLQQY